MELRAIRSGHCTCDDALVTRLFDQRQRLSDASTGGGGTVHLLAALIADFNGLRDVVAETVQVKNLTKQEQIKKARAPERAADDAEACRTPPEPFRSSGRWPRRVSAPDR